jgi:transporter family-2 protein
MGPEAVRHAAVMLAAGIGIPVLAALNAQLGARIGSPVAAGVVLFCVALLGATTVMVLSGSVSALARVPGQPGHLFLAGLLVAFYVLSITFVAPRFGVGNAIFFVLLGQMVSAAVIDQFGLFGAMVRPLTMLRLGGIGLMLAGLFLIQRG